MSNLSDFTGGSGGGSQVTAVASGALSNGDTVIINSDGTVSSVGYDSTAVSKNVPESSYVTFRSQATTSPKVAFDPNNQNRFVVAYAESISGYYSGVTAIGTVSGSSISFSDRRVFHTGYSGGEIYNIYDISFDEFTSDKFYILHSLGSTHTMLVVGTISGSTVSTSNTTVDGAANSPNGAALGIDANSENKLIVAYSDSTKCYVRTGTVSGTSVTYGTKTTINGGSTAKQIDLDTDKKTGNKFAISFSDTSSSNVTKCQIGTVSGTTITLGTAVSTSITHSTNTKTSIRYNPTQADNAVLVCANWNDNERGEVFGITISGTTPTLGTKVSMENTKANPFEVDFVHNTSDFLITYFDDDNSDGRMVTGSVDDTTITLGTAFDVGGSGDRTLNMSTGFNPSSQGQFVTVYRDFLESNYGKAFMGQAATTLQVPNITTSNYIGTSSSDYSDGDDAVINAIGSIDENQTGLTAANKYYVQEDGSLSTTEDTVSVYAGLAIDSTKLIIKG